jgi:hypothetical protein
MLDLRRTSLRHGLDVSWTTTLRVGEESTCGDEVVSCRLAVENCLTLRMHLLQVRR